MNDTPCRRPFWPTVLQTIGPASAVAMSSAMCVRADDANPKRNVLLVIVDDLRTELNCYGASRAITPNIDGLAARREGASVVLLEQTRHVGGLSTSGLNRDEGEHMDRATFGGTYERFSREAAVRSGTNPDARGARIWQSCIAKGLP